MPPPWHCGCHRAALSTLCALPSLALHFCPILRIYLFVVYLIYSVIFSIAYLIFLYLTVYGPFLHLVSFINLHNHISLYLLSYSFSFFLFYLFYSFLYVCGSLIFASYCFSSFFSRPLPFLFFSLYIYICLFLCSPFSLFPLPSFLSIVRPHFPFFSLSSSTILPSSLSFLHPFPRPHFLSFHLPHYQHLYEDWQGGCG